LTAVKCCLRSPGTLRLALILVISTGFLVIAERETAVRTI